MTDRFEITVINDKPFIELFATVFGNDLHSLYLKRKNGGIVRPKLSGKTKEVEVMVGDTLFGFHKNIQYPEKCYDSNIEEITKIDLASGFIDTDEVNIRIGFTWERTLRKKHKKLVSIAHKDFRLARRYI